MQLPFLPKKNPPTTQSREYFLSVEINDDSVRSAIWTIANSQVQILSSGPLSSWQSAHPDSLITAADQSLSAATQKIDPSGKIQPSKTIFGLPSYWIVNDRIDPSRVKLLKTFSQKLSLSVLGFVVTPEAIIHQLKKAESSNTTAILVGCFKSTLEMSLIKFGKVESVQQIRRSDHFLQDVVEGISRFPASGNLPSRIVLYDSGSDLEDKRQEILNYPWATASPQLSFLHLPRVEILTPLFSIQAVSSAGGEELLKLNPSPADLPRSSVSASPTVTAELSDLGFIEGADAEFSPAGASDLPDEPAVRQDEVSRADRAPRRPRLPGVRLPKISFAVPIAVFILLLAGIFYLIFFALRARVEVTLLPKSLSHDLTVQIDIGNDSKSIPPKVLGEIFTAVSQGQQSQKATGNKLIGDKAKGVVTIVNGTSAARSFAAGTTISSPSGLSFTLDDSVNVASASGSADPNSYQPGKANVNVTATNIGSDSNLTAGTQFRIGTFSSLDYVARNEAAFSGGTSRQATVVTKKDQDSLRSDLLAKLSSEVLSKLSADNPEQQSLIDKTAKVSVSKEVFSARVDEETTELSLDMTVSATATGISRSDLNTLVTEVIEGQIPASFRRYDIPQYQLGDVLVSGSQPVQVKVNVHTTILPEVDNQKIIKDISGKNFTQSRDVLKQLPQVESVKINLVPAFINFLQFLPRDPANVSLTVLP